MESTYLPVSGTAPCFPTKIGIIVMEVASVRVSQINKCCRYTEQFCVVQKLAHVVVKAEAYTMICRLEVEEKCCIAIQVQMFGNQRSQSYINSEFKRPENQKLSIPRVEKDRSQAEGKFAFSLYLSRHSWISWCSYTLVRALLYSVS